MKAEELMIGDWVFSPEFNRPCRIKAILEHEQAIFSQIVTSDISNRYLRECSQLEPIQLTDKILLASGFTLGTYLLPFSGRDIGKYSYANVTEKKVQECVVVPITKNCTWNFASVDETNVPVIQYVHELQHCLRLCGIDKEIML